MKTRITSKGRTNQLGRKTVITTIIVLVFQNLLFATPQARDVLFWNNNKYYVFPFIDIESILNGNELEELNAVTIEDIHASLKSPTTRCFWSLSKTRTRMT